jgi:hypothetical protein
MEAQSQAVIQVVVPAVFGLLGVWVGGWITTRSQKIERQHQRIREQLSSFYSVLLGIRSQILAKSEVRLKLRKIAQKIQQADLIQAQNNPQVRQYLSTVKNPEFRKLIEYDNQQLQDEFVPQYREMLAHVTKNMWLAEPSTLGHYAALVEYVELWNRALERTIPDDVLFELDHDEKKLHPFYTDLDLQFKRLQQELTK